MGLAMSEITRILPAQSRSSEQVAVTPSRWAMFANEDWWSVWIGLLVIVVAWALFANGSSLKWLAVAPAKWKTLAEAWEGRGSPGPK